MSIHPCPLRHWNNNYNNNSTDIIIIIIIIIIITVMYVEKQSKFLTVILIRIMTSFHL